MFGRPGIGAHCPATTSPNCLYILNFLLPAVCYPLEGFRWNGSHFLDVPAHPSPLSSSPLLSESQAFGLVCANAPTTHHLPKTPYFFIQATGSLVRTQCYGILSSSFRVIPVSGRSEATSPNLPDKAEACAKSVRSLPSEEDKGKPGSCPLQTGLPLD